MPAVFNYRGDVDDDFIMAFASTLAFYFLYELITKKNVKKMFAAAKGLWVLLVIAVVFSGAMIIGRNHIINYDLSAEDIESVEIIDDNSYYLSPQAKILTLDPELAKECAARAYRDTCDELRAQGRINAHNALFCDF